MAVERRESAATERVRSAATAAVVELVRSAATATERRSEERRVGKECRL